MRILRRSYSLLIAIATVVLFMSMKGIFVAKSVSEIFLILTDCFFATGVIMFGIGLLGFCSRWGAFDMLKYSFNLLASNLGFKKRKAANFHEYKISKKDKKPRLDFLVSGLVTILISLLFLTLFLNV